MSYKKMKDEAHVHDVVVGDDKDHYHAMVVCTDKHDSAGKKSDSFQKYVESHEKELRRRFEAEKS